MTTLSSLEAPQASGAPGKLRTRGLTSHELRLASGVPRERLRRLASVSWEKPASGSLLFGFGSAIRLGGSRDEGIEDGARLARTVARLAPPEALDGPARPRLFGGARFAPGAGVVDEAWDSFGGWQFLLPALLISEREGSVTGSFSWFEDSPGGEREAPERILEWLCDGEPSEPPADAVPDESVPRGLSREDWEAMVARSVDEIRSGLYEKAVLARMVVYRQETAIDDGRVLGRLAERYGNCFVFKYSSGAATWLGASPELLLSYRGGTLRTASLAGSRPRGTDEEDDARLAAELLASAKERAEHEFVARALREGLGPLCSELTMPDEPQVASIANIHHLYTPIEATVRPGHDAFDLVAAVQPTPAVGGWPRDAALDAIERLEGLDRGWYAGPIGWVDFTGHGEFAVGLRSALVDGPTARLYAGAGIVAASEPGEEYLETETKLRPLREALGD